MTRPTARQAEKELADQTRFLKAWRRFHREEREAALAGPHGAILRGLFRMVGHLRAVQPAQLVGVVQSIDWSTIPYDIRLVVVHELNASITRYREKRGLDPIDDPLPGQPESPFRTIKAIVLTP